MKRELTCIVCPMGCALCAELDGNKVISVEGNSCPRGAKYATDECTAPTRTLTSTVCLKGCAEKRLPVKTSAPIAKDRLFEAMELIKKISVTAPIRCGDVIDEDFCGEKLVSCATVE